MASLTIINRMQRYGDGLTTPLSLESDGDFTRSYGALQIGKYNVPPTNKPANASLLNNVWYQPEEVYAVTGTPEVRAHAFFVKVDKFYYGLAKNLSVSCLWQSTCHESIRLLKQGLSYCLNNVR